MLDLLRAGNFNGASFLVRSATTEGGRKQVKHEFPNSNKQSIEDLGFRPKTFRMVVETTASFVNGELDAQSYFDNRDALIAALDRGGVGTLSHPFFTTNLQVVAMPYTFEESTTELGIAVFNLTFEASDRQVNPQPNAASLPTINQKTQAVTSQYSSDLSGIYEASTGFNVNAAADILSDYFTSAGDNVQSVPVTTDKINQFSANLIAFQDDIISLAQDPDALSAAVINVIQNIRGLYATADSALDVYIQFFDFGDTFSPVSPTTANRIEQKRNQDLLTNSLQAAYLAQAYQAASVKEYTTVDEVDEIKTTLELQYDKVIDGDISGDLRETLADLRVIVNQFLDNERLTARRIQTVFTNRRPLRALAFDYYAEDNDEVTTRLADLNDITDLSFVEGELQVLSS